MYKKNDGKKISHYGINQVNPQLKINRTQIKVSDESYFMSPGGR